MPLIVAVAVCWDGAWFFFFVVVVVAVLYFLFLLTIKIKSSDETALPVSKWKGEMWVVWCWFGYCDVDLT